MTQSSPVMLLFLGLLTGIATLAGGILVLRVRSRLDLIMAASAGALIGLAVFDVLPEAAAAATSLSQRAGLAIAVLAGFGLYLALDRAPGWTGVNARAAFAGPAVLTIHSVLDGFGIGIGFQRSATLGLAIFAGVIAHDLADGANTVTLSLTGDRRLGRAAAWLAADAIAPVAGIALSLATRGRLRGLAYGLAFFAGVFLYLGACDLFWRAWRERPRPTTMAASLAGLAAIYVITAKLGL